MKYKLISGLVSYNKVSHFSNTILYSDANRDKCNLNYTFVK